jgi:hypothetical protein
MPGRWLSGGLTISLAPSRWNDMKVVP